MGRPVRFLSVLLVVSVLFACSGDDDDSASGTTTTSEATTTTAAASGKPDWLTALTDADVEQVDDFNGHDVWLDREGETVYMESCDDARAITAAGAPYGPTDKPGWAFICPN